MHLDVTDWFEDSDRLEARKLDQANPPRTSSVRQRFVSRSTKVTSYSCNYRVFIQ
jgi:hypothetical protein